jgi:signal transduction histidine kinase
MSTKKQISPEILVPRIGEYLVQNKIITLSDLNRALYIQLEKAKQGDERLLGQILIELDLINQESLDIAITEQLIQLRDALEQSNHQLEIRVQQRTAELQNALKKINELNDLKNNFISNISHELRTPLTHIKGYLDLMISKDLGPVSEDQEQVLEIMGRATSRLEKLIEDLIMFTFAEHDEIVLSKSEFDLFNIVQNLVTSFQRSHAQIDFLIENEISNELALVYGDQKKISWVINQLIENAVKYSSNDSKVLIKLSSEFEKIKLSISDHGIGIPDEKIPEIFEPFHQLDGSSTRKAGGVGLGLALAKRIIEAHGSSINVKSQINQGSTFDFSLRKLIQ